ncbi:hypothetical protein PR202_gb05174 [Eleusine coracana subsp. coracana]|uniref:Origin of replication complex subunit 4 n=1 Tax=Eleusine coracana subsp. coracana TaxID=191504 RepID=A0AAV5E6D8_ELECO|nr:hypothetical protein PR202_gb05174 [Eleusine coracana subsp. coracana]
MAAAAGSVASQAQAVLRARLCDPSFVHSALRSSPDTNYSKLKYLVASSVSEACNNSVLLLGPRGCGKAAVRVACLTLRCSRSLIRWDAAVVFDEMCARAILCHAVGVRSEVSISVQVVDMVLDDLKEEHPDAISVIRLNGMLHSDDNCAVKEIARQLCLEHQLSFSKMVHILSVISLMTALSVIYFNGLFSFRLLQTTTQNSLLTCCSIGCHGIIFQGKQRLLYSLLDAMQSLTSQAIVIGVSCRLDADQLLEKRVRSRFSHRKLLFVPSSVDNIERSKFVLSYTLQNIFGDKKFKGILNSLMEADSATSNILRFLFRSVSYMDMESGFLSMESFVSALSPMQRQPKMDSLQGIFLVASKLEDKEQSSYNFTSIMKEYRSIQEAYKTSDKYASTVCFRAFEHLLDRELISFADSKGRNQSLEYRPVKLLISSREIAQSLKSNTACPAVLQKLLDRERYM